MKLTHWIAFALSAAMMPLASATTITFNDLSNGDIVNSQYNAQYGVTFNGTNVAKNTDNVAVVFDTSLLNTQDPDLQAPFFNVNQLSQLNLAIANPGNVLIIHENEASCNAISCANPDDEGSRPSGFFSIDFENSVTLNSLDFFDIETEEASQDNAIHLYGLNGVEINPGQFNTLGTGGNNTWDRLIFDIAEVYSVEIRLNGSGAISNLDFTATAVPEPSTFAVLGLALLGFAGASRRKTN